MAVLGYYILRITWDAVGEGGHKRRAQNDVSDATPSAAPENRERFTA